MVLMYTGPCNLLLSLLFCLLLGWGEWTSFLALGRMDKDISFLELERMSELYQYLYIDIDIYRNCKSFLMVEEKYLFWSVIKFYTPTSLKGASRFYSNSEDPFLQGSLGISIIMDKQWRQSEGDQKELVQSGMV